MNLAFYTSAVGTIQLQKGLDTIANNIANISTNGYKPSTVSFSELMHTNMRGNGQNLTVGSGAKLQKTDTIFERSALRDTGRVLDYAILDKNGFFGIVSQTGHISYTRDGNFNLQELQNGSFVLVSSQGGYVADKNNNPIIIKDPKQLSETNLGIGVFSFKNIDGLTRAGNGFFEANEVSGQPWASAVETKRGYLEMSGVQLASEMADVITTQRAFQMNARMVQISDEVEQTINNLR
ncbi:MAG: flagellar hook-basal body protein [Oscillospiraceae bacterium]